MAVNIKDLCDNHFLTFCYESARRIKLKGTSTTNPRNLRSERFFSLLVCLHPLTKKVAQKCRKIDSIGMFTVAY